MKQTKLIIIAVLFLSFSIFIIQRFIIPKKIKSNGIHLTATIAPLKYNITYFSQDSSLWAKDTLGKSEYILGYSGCLVASLASCFTFYGDTINPQELNTMLSDSNVYNESGEILWYKLMPLFPKIKYTPPRVFNSNDISEDLKNEILPIVKVKYHKKGYWHWVLIRGCTEEDFIILDPLNYSNKEMALNEHGKVYAYRRLSRIANKKMYAPR